MTKKILVGAVTSKRHEEYIDKWLDMVGKLTYPHDLFIVDTTVGTDEFAKHLQSKGVEVAHLEWSEETHQIMEALAEARNLIRKKFLDGDYDFVFQLDTDEFVPSNSLELLVQHDKDNVGFPTPIWHGIPAVFKTEGLVPSDDGKFKLDSYSWEELIQRTRREKSTLLRVHSVGVGCLLTKRCVFEDKERGFFWRVPHFPQIAEDTIFYTEVPRAGWEFYVDMSVIPLHLSVGWKNVSTFKKGKYNGELKFIHGFVTDDEPGTRKLEYYGCKN